MPRLEQKMKQVSERAAGQLPDEALEVMQRHTRELEDSGLADHAVGEGDDAADFALPDQDGEVVRLADLTARGPVILSFYRGRW